jgi:hypothetical protein
LAEQLKIEARHKYSHRYQQIKGTTDLQIILSEALLAEEKTTLLLILPYQRHVLGRTHLALAFEVHHVNLQVLSPGGLLRHYFDNIFL